MPRMRVATTDIASTALNVNRREKRCMMCVCVRDITGKQYYFKQDNGQVYSRASGRFQSQEEAIAEFIDDIRRV